MKIATAEQKFTFMMTFNPFCNHWTEETVVWIALVVYEAIKEVCVPSEMYSLSCFFRLTFGGTHLVEGNSARGSPQSSLSC